MAINKVVYGATTLIDLTNDTVASEKMLQGTTAHGADGSAITGSIANKGTVSKILDTTSSGWRYDLDSGYYTGGAIYVINEQRSCVPANSTIEVTPENGHVLSKVTVAPMPTGSIEIGDKNVSFVPTLRVDSTGLVTAVQDVSMQTTVSSLTSGYIGAVESFRVNCSGSSSLQLTTQAAAIYTPTTTNQTIASGQYLTGVQTIVGDSNLVAANIKQGVTIFGIEGTAKTDPALQSKSATPTEIQQNIVADTGYDGLSSVTVNAIDSSYVGSNVIRRSSTDLSASGSVVTVPSGYYAAAASKTVAAGAAVTPATSITANPSIALDSATGIVSAVATASKSITPTVTSGYVSSGGSGTVTVSGSNDFQLPVKAAATYIPTTTNQTIAAGQYLTGAQTIAGDSNLVAGNIKNGTMIFGVSGTFGPDDIIIIGDYGLCFNNFSISSNTCISEAGTVSGNTLIAV